MIAALWVRGARDRVMADDSALRNLWDGTPSAGEFHASVAAVRAALANDK